jgi:hypothetical protein
MQHRAGPSRPLHCSLYCYLSPPCCVLESPPLALTAIPLRMADLDQIRKRCSSGRRVAGVSSLSSLSPTSGSFIAPRDAFLQNPDCTGADFFKHLSRPSASRPGDILHSRIEDGSKTKDSPAPSQVFSGLPGLRDVDPLKERSGGDSISQTSRP